MKTDTVAFTEKNNAPNREPRFVVAISFDDDDIDITYLTSSADTPLPPGTAAIDIIHDVIPVGGISGQTQKIAPEKAQHTIGSITVRAVDTTGAIATKIKSKRDADFSLRKKRVKVYIGFKGLPWEDFAERVTYRIDKVSYKDKVYSFTISDIQREERKTLFEPDQAVLTSSISATALEVPLTTHSAVNKFKLVAHDNIYSSDRNDTVGYIKIDDEVIRHRGWTDESYRTLKVDGPTGRGALRTAAMAHTVTATATDKKKKVEEYFYLEMAAPKMVYALLTGVLAGQGASLPDHWHLGIPGKYVRLSDFQTIGADLWDTVNSRGRIARFIGLKKAEGKKFIEEQVLLWMGGFMPVYADGALGLKRLQAVLPFSPYVAHLGVDDIQTYGALDYDHASVVNRVTINWNYIDSLDKFTKTTHLINGAADAPPEIFEFEGVFSGLHSDNDINNYFRQYLDRFGSEPLRHSMVAMPWWNNLDVGDPIRVTNPHVLDDNEDMPLDRVWEIQQATPDWFSGLLKLTLFGGTNEASIKALSATNTMQDSFYESGQDLSNVLTIVNGVVTASGTVPGATLMASAIYRYDGDLEIGPDAVVTLAKNVLLKVKGFLTINGHIVCQGSSGQSGVFGTTRTGRPVRGKERHFGRDKVKLTSASRIVTGDMHELPSFNLANEDGTEIIPIPQNLLGVNGSTGERSHLSGTSSEPPGGAAGSGGGGAVFICRGAEFGGSGSINCSGSAGSLGGIKSWEGETVWSQSGSGGAAGAVLFLIDGNYSAPTLTATNAIAALGVTPTPPGITKFARNGYRKVKNDIIYGERIAAPVNQFRSLIRTQYIPPPVVPFPWFPADEDKEAVSQGYDSGFIPADVTNFIVSQSGGPVIFKWKPQGEGVVFEIRYGPRGNTNFEDATPLTVNTRGSNLTSSDVKPGDWTFFIVAKSDIKQIRSPNVTQRSMVVLSPLDIIEKQVSGPDWPGILNGFEKHWTGVLVPKSTSVNADIGWRTFDEFVPDPVAVASYEGLEIDIGFDDSPRVWGEITSALGSGESGIADPVFSIDHRLDAGSYDGFEDWSIGQQALRYAKAKLTLDTSEGVAYIQNMELVVDQQEFSQGESAVSIAPGGSTIVFPVSYHKPPQVQVFAEGSVAVLPTYELVTETGFTFHLFDTSASDTGGIGGWRATGV